MSEQESTEPERVEPPVDKVDPHFDGVAREDYADLPDDLGEGSAVGKAKKAKRDGD